MYQMHEQTVSPPSPRGLQTCSSKIYTDITFNSFAFCIVQQQQTNKKFIPVTSKNTQSRPHCPQSSYKHVEDRQAFNRLPRRLVNVHRLFHILAPGRRPALGLALGPALSRLRFPLCWPRSLSSSGTQVQPTATET